ncbi:MAG TPA: serine hydrolase [Ignavibacteria bacterium]|nr:serine hydrolase [Ignavibacteria bacterium]
MNKLKLIILILILFMIGLRKTFPQISDNEIISFADSLLKSSYESDGPGLSLLISRNGNPVYKEAFGLADIEHSIPLSTENVFNIGSMSKQFTAVCILQLAESGKLNLKDDIRKYLPDYNAHGKIITIENCLNHTSGIPSFTEIKGFDLLFQKNLSVKEMTDYFSKNDLLFEPGTDFSYSNSGYFLLALITEKASGMNFDKYLKENIFDKAGMKNSYSDVSGIEIPLKAVGYDRKSESEYQITTDYEKSWTVGAGNLMSTTGDLLKWNDALNSGKIVSKQLLQIAWTPFILPNGLNTNYGYGWNITPLNKRTIIKHGGAINGFLSDADYIPEEEIYIAALSNSTGKSPDLITGKILQRILGINDIVPAEIPLDVGSINDYTGSFEVNRESVRLIKNFSDEKQYRYIFLDGDSLKIQKSGGEKLTLKSYGKDKFFIDNSSSRFDYIRDGSGKITALDVYTYPVNFGPHDICQKVNVSMPIEKEEISLSEDILKPYEGEYELMPGFNLKIFVEKGVLFIQATGQEKYQLFPESNTKFFMKVVDAQAEFIPDSDGSVNKLIFTQGQKFECKRIK